MDNQDNIILRPLKLSDAGLMLEWMHDPQMQSGFKKDMLHVSLEQAQMFCRTAATDMEDDESTNRHWAISDTDGEYLGTISLKNIDRDNSKAEYAIALRKKACGRGIGTAATRLLLKKAFLELDLHKVYLTVLEDNLHAIRMYERNGFVCEGMLREHLKIGNRYVGWKLYAIIRSDYIS